MNEIRFTFDSMEEFGRTFTRLFQSLPQDERLPFRRAFQQLLCLGVDEASRRMKDRTVAEIISEAEALDIAPLASGRVAYSCPEPRAE